MSETEDVNAAPVEPIVSLPLKPCPFCGSPAVIIDYGYEPRVECTECNGQTRIITSREHAVAAWNKRAVTGVVMVHDVVGLILLGGDTASTAGKYEVEIPKQTIVLSG